MQKFFNAMKKLFSQISSFDVAYAFTGVFVGICAVVLLGVGVSMIMDVIPEENTASEITLCSKDRVDVVISANTDMAVSSFGKNFTLLMEDQNFVTPVTGSLLGGGETLEEQEFGVKFSTEPKSFSATVIDSCVTMGFSNPVNYRSVVIDPGYYVAIFFCLGISIWIFTTFIPDKVKKMFKRNR